MKKKKRKRTSRLGPGNTAADRNFRARWVESCACALYRQGVRFPQIATYMVAASIGDPKALAILPQIPSQTSPLHFDFPAGWTIGAHSVCKAFYTAMRREPQLQAKLTRQIGLERCDHIYLYLQPGVMKGSPPAANAAARVLELRARLDGTLIDRIELEGGGAPLLLHDADDKLLAAALQDPEVITALQNFYARHLASLDSADGGGTPPAPQGFDPGSNGHSNGGPPDASPEDDG